MSRIFLLRHGQTFSNVDRAFDTRPPGAELTELGRSQAQHAGQELAADAPVISHWYSSVALRAQQTTVVAAAAYEQARGLPRYSVPLTVIPGAHEIFAGDFEMSSAPQAHAAYRQALDGWLAGDPEAAMPGGESTAQVIGRLQQVAEGIVSSGELQRGDVVLTSHGAAIRVLATHATSVSPQWASSAYVSNCRYVILEPGEQPFGSWRLVHWPDAVLPRR